MSHIVAVPDPGVLTRVTDHASLLVAPNACAWTFEGTNTWLLAGPDDDSCVVVDPGPLDPIHLDRIRAAAGARMIAEIWLTHGHDDHADGAWPLAAATRALVRMAGGGAGTLPLIDDACLVVGSIRADVVATPGHTADSVCFMLPENGVLLTGDTVFGRGSPFVEPDGMSEMLASLRRLLDLTSKSDSTMIALPGHGPVVLDAERMISHRLQGRLSRIGQVEDLMAQGCDDPAAMVRVMYPDITDPVLQRAAESSTTAALAYVVRMRSEQSRGGGNS
jgi:glyoxylase-like metal-dependent hydrolase (beta-lactamase superfamily II)